MCYSAYTQSRLRESRSWANALLQMTVPKQSLEKIETKNPPKRVWLDFDKVLDSFGIA